LVLAVLAIAAGCHAKKRVVMPPIPVAKIYQVPSRIVDAATSAATLPAKMMGCAWDYGEMPAGLYFEVWSSTNLVHWVLATNTTEKIARFPMKPCEFWKVRARDTNGLVSDWATTGR